jgi:hypothetical protein
MNKPPNLNLSPDTIRQLLGLTPKQFNKLKMSQIAERWQKEKLCAAEIVIVFPNGRSETVLVLEGPELPWNP